MMAVKEEKKGELINPVVYKDVKLPSGAFVLSYVL
jgi:hypothetical protein